MDQSQFNQLLRLAKQIGGQAWKLLVEQQIIVGSEQLVGSAFFLLGIAIAGYIFNRARSQKRNRIAEAEKEAEERSYGSYYHPDLEGEHVIMVATALCALVLLGCFVPLAIDGVGHVLFPEAYAIGALSGI